MAARAAAAEAALLLAGALLARWVLFEAVAVLPRQPVPWLLAFLHTRGATLWVARDAPRAARLVRKLGGLRVACDQADPPADPAWHQLGLRVIGLGRAEPPSCKLPRIHLH